jgi:hypothetical protein
MEQEENKKNTELVRETLGSRVEFHSVAGAVHFSFLTPCGLLGPY